MFGLTIEQWTLILAVLGLIATVFGYWHSNRSKKKEWQDELESMNSLDKFPMTYEARKRYERKSFLEKQLKNKK